MNIYRCLLLDTRVFLTGGGSPLCYFQIYKIRPTKLWIFPMGSPTSSGILCPIFFYKITLSTFSSKLFLTGAEIIPILWEYFSSNTVENCNSIQSSVTFYFPCIAFLLYFLRTHENSEVKQRSFRNYLFYQFP